MIYFLFLIFLSLFSSFQGGKAPLRRAIPPFTSALTNRTMTDSLENLTFPQAYLKLPVFVHSELPPLEKLHLYPVKASGLEPLPRPVRVRLLPGPARPPGPSGHRTVRTSCKMDKMLVRVPKSILGVGEINQLKLGSCQATKSSKNYIYFLHGLDQCGTKRQMINGQMTYSNTLQYNPEMHLGLIRRSVPFVMPVVCNYTRYQYSYKVGYLPKMRMRHIFKAMRNRANFILTPLNVRWERFSPSDKYVLGEPMRFEAEGPSVPQDMRLYVHSCYATPNKSHISKPQFPVVKDFGCMIESKYGRSRFIPYKNNVVRFSVDAFYFQGMTDQQLYMHCTMSVESDVPTPTAKTCNYDTNLGRWVELHGWDWVCACCDSSCGSAAVSEVTTSRGWKVQPRGQPFKNHKRKQPLFFSTTTTTTTTTVAPSVVKTTLEVIQSPTTPRLQLIDVTELKWPFGGRGVEWVEEEEQVMEEDVLETHPDFDIVKHSHEPKVKAMEKSQMKILTLKTSREATEPEAMGKVADWEWEDEEMVKKGSAVVEVIKEPRRTFEDIFEFDQ
ncbi:zona pellucida sperm-binding protein 3d.2 isoform X2 [Syngnathus scovelli]|uniref:zona pellucida sperm-binding protein 3d.2 isoform X2 n=1 Tax=Syngnathus scovelli TaxID=161590 RepID=UPI0021104780|nr:zona pellucida sperm-binding protein 3d.2 isoform X2 [Syngnathus scovelli]